MSREIEEINKWVKRLDYCFDEDKNLVLSPNECDDLSIAINDMKFRYVNRIKWFFWRIMPKRTVTLDFTE